MSWDIIIFSVCLGYIFGSIPFGLVLTKIAGLGDVRNIGSGNIGATNVLRTGHKGLAALTLFLDLAKGTAAVLSAQALFGPGTGFYAGIAAFVGHVFPVWIKFKGGKGVATYIGVLVGLFWPAAVGFAIIWLVIAFITRYSSLSALVASALVTVGLGVWQHWELAFCVLLMTCLIFYRHSANIKRLIKGEEPKIGAK
ncbi:MAG: glycerol-3-phosphate 1-O-acyltransferase PlsY [Pseudomonadota bacterium]